MAVAHVGLVIGSGVFEVSEISKNSSRLTWTEDLQFPWFLGGVVTAFAARPILKRIWMGNLHRFKMIQDQANRF